MLHLTSESKILLAIKPIDFRKQIDGLVAVCRNHLGQEPTDGTLFIFINRSMTSIKVLCYEDNGFWLGVKRLSRGRFAYWPSDNTKGNIIKAYELKKILKSTLASKLKLNAKSLDIDDTHNKILTNAKKL